MFRAFIRLAVGLAREPEFHQLRVIAAQDNPSSNSVSSQPNGGLVDHAIDLRLSRRVATVLR
jgi:hypothetical protein